GARTISVTGSGPAGTARGMLRGALWLGRTLAVWGETMFLQQSCLWLDGLQGIVRQHFMACWSWVMARHSAKGTASRRLTATTKDVSLRSILLNSRLYWT